MQVSLRAPSAPPLEPLVRYATSSEAVTALVKMPHSMQPPTSSCSIPAARNVAADIQAAMRAESRRNADGDLYRLGKISAVPKPGGGSSTAKQRSIDKSEGSNGNLNRNHTTMLCPKWFRNRHVMRVFDIYTCTASAPHQINQ